MPIGITRITANFAGPSTIPCEEDSNIELVKTVTRAVIMQERDGRKGSKKEKYSCSAHVQKPVERTKMKAISFGGFSNW
jgi:hypothetical protein